MFGVSFRWIKIYSSVILISLISKLTGFIRDAMITARFGATLITDAYVVALLIPEVLFNIFGNSLTANFAPVYYEAEASNRHRRFVSVLFSLYILLATLIFLIGFKNTDFFITLISSGFKGEALHSTRFLLKIFMANIFFITITYFCLTFLQAKDQFMMPSTIGVFFNLAIIIAMGGKDHSNPLYLLIAGTITGYIAQFAVQIPQAIACGLSMPTWRITLDPEIRKFLKLTPPIAVLAVLGQLNIAMDNYFASRLHAGSITTLNLGYRVLMGLYSLIITNTMMIVYPALSKSIVYKDHEHTAALIQKTANLLIILLLPLVFFLIINAHPVIDLMFRRGAFTANQSSLTALVFQGYISGLLFFAFRDLLLKYCFATHSAIIPMLNGLANSSLNFLYLLILVPLLGLPGVSLATTLSAVSSCLVLFFWIKKNSPAFRRLVFFNLIWKITLISGVSLLFTKATDPAISFLIPGQNISSQVLRMGTEFAIFTTISGFLFVVIFNKKIFGYFC